MARNGRVRVDIDLDASGVDKGTKDAERHLERLNRAGTHSLNALKSAAVGVGLAVGAGIAAVGTVGLKEAIEQEKVSARTKNVIETTGKAANVSKKQVEDLSSTLQKQTGTADDAIQAGANLLLTFTKVRNEAGKGNDVFNQGVAISNDLSVALGKDLNASTIMVGKALNDPIKGITALGKAGVQFDADQKKQIKTMVESGNVLGAQKMILGELEKQVGGAASSEGELTESAQEAQRTFEDFSESIMVRVLPVLANVIRWAQENFPRFKAYVEEAFEGGRVKVEQVMTWYRANVLPTIRAIVAGAKRFWDMFGDDIQRVFGFIVRQVQRSMTVIKAIIELVLAVLRGDWGKAWESLKTIARTALAGVIDTIRTITQTALSVAGKLGLAIVRGIGNGLSNLASSIRQRIVTAIRGTGDLAGALLNKGVEWGKKIISGIVEGIKSAPGAIGRALRDAMPDPGGGVPFVPGIATGGFTPGPYKGYDDRLVALAGNEAVLNPRQQAMVPGGRSTLMDIFRRTGASMGGGFAAGGLIGGAWPAAATAFMSEARAASYSQKRRGERGYMDCSEFATGLAKTFGYSGPITWTGGAMSNSTPAKGNEPIVWGLRGLNREASQQHMGIRVNGTWYDFGGSGLDTGDSRWDVLRVPTGIDVDTRVATASDGTAKTETPLQRVTRLLARTGLVKDNTKAAGAIGRTLLAGVPDLSDGTAPAFTGSQDRSVSSAGRAARDAERRRPGSTPESVAAAGDRAERDAEIKILNRQKLLAKEDLDILRIRKGDVLRDYQRLGRKKVGVKGRAAKRKLMAQYRAKLKALTAEMSEVREEIAEINDRLMEIGEAIAQEQWQENYDNAQEAAADRNAAADPAAASSVAASDPDADARAAQADARALAAQQESQALSAYVNSLRGSGSIDPALGTTVNQYIYGGMVEQSWAASWITNALANQGGPSNGYVPSPV